MNPEATLSVFEKIPAYARGAARLADEAFGTTRFSKALGVAHPPGSMLSDLAGRFPDLKIQYPGKEELLGASVKDLTHNFLNKRDSISKALSTVDGQLPHLGLHGTSAPFAERIFATRSFNPIDFATPTPEATQLPARAFVSGVGKGVATGVNFSEKWQGMGRGEPGPVFVLDVGKADQLSGLKTGIRRPYSDMDYQPMAELMPGARQFKGTLYNIHPGNFDSIVLGHIDYSATQGARPLVAALNESANEKLAAGASPDKVLPDTWQRGQIIDATRRLDLAHKAISRWLIRHR